MNKTLIRILAGAMLSAAMTGYGQAATISVLPGMDDTIYADQLSNNNGAASQTVVGRRNNAGELRRALLWFDVASNVPVGATITDVILSMIQPPVGQTAAQRVDLFRLERAWQEGDNFTANPPAGGAPATSGSVTWRYSAFDSTEWTTPGGDFNPISRAFALVNGDSVDTVHTWTSALLASDVQNWLDNPSQNYGWTAIGVESANNQLRRFYSREAANGPIITGDIRPVLTISYIPEPAGLALLVFAVGGTLTRKRCCAAD